MQIYHLVIIITALFLSKPAFADGQVNVELKPVVVTASKIEEPLYDVPASIEVVSGQEIKDRQVLTLDEALRTTPGLVILSHGGSDPLPFISIRGTDNYHSLVLIDGIKINSIYDQTPYTGSLLFSNTERIEIVKGSYSALYGSEAIGGVINVITSDQPEFTYSIRGGTHKTSAHSLLYSNRHKDTVYTLGYENFSTEGFKFSGPYWNNTFLGRMSFPLSTTSSLKLSSYYWDWRKYDRNVGFEIKEYDSINGIKSIITVLDDDSNIKENSWLNSIQYAQSPLNWWDYNVKLAKYATNSLLSNSLDSPTPDRPYPIGIRSDINSSRDVFEMQHNFYFDDSDILTAGFHYTEENLEKEEYGNRPTYGLGPVSDQPHTVVDAKRSSRAIYLQNLFKIRKRLSISAGARFENGPGFSNKLIPKASALYVVPAINTKLNISYGLGIRAPSVEDLYHPSWGNTGLKPEESTSIEAGFEQPLVGNNISFKASAFSIKLKNLIDIDSTSFKLENIFRSEIEGVETSLRWAISENIVSNIGYIRLMTEDLDTGEELPFRPDYRWTLDIRYRPVEQLIFDLNAEIVGESSVPLPSIPVIGIDGKPLSGRVAPHKVVNVASAYNLIKRDPTMGSLDFTLKLNNIFDEEYEELFTFRNYGFTFIAGIRATY